MKFSNIFVVAALLLIGDLLVLPAYADEELLEPLHETYSSLEGADTPSIFSKRLMALYNAAIKNSELLQEAVPGLDFFYAVNGQDFEDGLQETVTYEILSQNAEIAEVIVRFRNFVDQTLGYSLVFEEDIWVIDDVKCMTPDCNWVYSELLMEGASIKP